MVEGGGFSDALALDSIADGLSTKSELRAVLPPACRER